MTRAAFAPLALAGLLAGCGTLVSRTPEPAPAPTPAPASAPASPAGAPQTATPRPGGYYKDDGPGDNPPANLDTIADAEPRVEPLHRFANNPYTVFGQDYVPMRELRPYRERGLGSWYGRRFHGLPTSSGEPYDMYGMTAAHPLLPIPSYARVTNLANGRSVVVRINDRGPFHAGRIVDLSYAAASKLGYAGSGSALLELAAIAPGDMALRASRREPARAINRGPPDRKAPAAPAGDPGSATIAAAATIPLSARTSGLYLQLGAFSARENADNFLSRVRGQLGWLDRAIEVLQEGGLFRLHLGPYRDRLEAIGIAERIREALDLKTVIVVK